MVHLIRYWAANAEAQKHDKNPAEAAATHTICLTAWNLWFAVWFGVNFLFNQVHKVRMALKAREVQLEIQKKSPESEPLTRRSFFLERTNYFNNLNY